MQIGGMYSVRGYPEGDYVADNGGILNVDWFFPCYFVPAKWTLPGDPQSLRSRITPVLFVDYGAGKLKMVNQGEEERKSLMGMGAGLKIKLWDSAALRLQWAKDMKDRPVSGSGPSVFYLQFQGEM